MSSQENLEKFLEKNSLQLIDKISKGFSSEIYLVCNAEGKKFALKIERDKSRRINMVEKEVANLQLANKHGIGPKLISFDSELKTILLEFIEGTSFSNWLNRIPSKQVLQKAIDSLYEQAKKLDEIGLDHGQLAGRGSNILIRKENFLPVIIDFEKASQSRKCHNKTSLDAFLFRNPTSDIVKKVKQILGTMK